MVMKQKTAVKVILTGLSCFCLFISAGKSTLARNYTCDVCGNGTIQIVSSHIIHNVHCGFIPCNKINGVMDEVVYKTVTENNEACNNCGVSYTYKVYGDMEIICKAKTN